MATVLSTPGAVAGATIKDKRRAGKYLSFQLGREEYAIQVLKVREIVKLQHITSVPETPVDVRGVINLRGKVIPVIDLRLKFGMPEMEYGHRTCIIVVELQSSIHGPMGIIVDEVSEVLNLVDSDIQDTPDFGKGVETPFLLGMARVKDKVKILLDIDEVLTTADLQALSSVLS
jgi:purine-binding chemotaxis protein CheW